MIVTYEVLERRQQRDGGQEGETQRPQLSIARASCDGDVANDELILLLEPCERRLTGLARIEVALAACLSTGPPSVSFDCE